MRKYFLVLAVLAILPLAAASAGEQPADLEQRVKAVEDALAKPPAQPLKLGIVSEEEVLDNLEEKQEIGADITLMEQKARDVLKAIQNECKNLEAEIELRAQGSEERAKKVKECDAKKEELASKYKTLSADIQQQAKKKLDDLRAKLRTTIARFAREQHYTLVIEKSALLYGEEGDSLTTNIIDLMNDEYWREKKQTAEETTKETTQETPAK